MTVEETLDRIKEFKESESIHITPNTMILSGHVLQYLYDQGYRTREQIMELMRSIAESCERGH